MLAFKVSSVYIFGRVHGCLPMGSLHRTTPGGLE